MTRQVLRQAAVGAIALGLGAVVVTGCDEREAPASKPAGLAQADQTSGDQIITTFYPTEFFASRLSGGLVKVSCPVPPEADPIFWKPDDASIARYQGADLIIVNGAEYEKWTASASLPLTRVVDTSHAFEGELLKFQGQTHSHGAAGAHTHTGVDGHTWIDPVLAKRQAQAILAGMTRRWPEHEKAFAANFQKLDAELGELDAKWQRLAPAMKAARLYAGHPAYGYPARRYGIEISNVNLPPDEPVSEASWAELAGAIAKEGTNTVGPRTMLFESDPLESTAKELQARHQMVCVVFSPCETLALAARAKGEDYLTVMNSNLDRLALALGVKTPK